MNTIDFRRLRIVSGICLAAVLCFTPAVFAQMTGTIAGTVTDPSGLGVPGAKVTATAANRGFTRTTTSNQQGGYVMPLLPIGEYTVTVSASGFRVFNQAGITLTAGENARIDARLEVGSTTQAVNVTAGAPLVDSRSSQYGWLISPDSVLDLPLNGRNVVDLAELEPGVAHVNAPESFTGDRSGPTYAANGARENSNLYLFDGMPYNALFRNTGLNYPPPDAVQEIHVITGSYSAKYGRNGGSVFSVITKSGTNQFHGSAWEYVRNNAFNANNFFGNASGTPVQKLIENQFGGDAGGPIIKNKLFVFAAYEGLRDHTSPLSTGAFPPTQAERQGDFSAVCTSGFDSNGVCKDRSKGNVTDQIYEPSPSCDVSKPSTCTPFKNNQVPKTDFDPIALKFLSPSIIPLPNQPNGEYVTTSSQPIDNDEGLLRVDYNLGHNDLFGHYDQGHTTQTKFGGNIPSYEPIALTANTFNMVAGGTFILSPHIVNEARIGYNRFVSSEPTSANASLNSFGSNFPVIGPPTPPELTIGSLTLGTNSSVNETNVNEIFDANDSFEQQEGGHDLEYGAEFLRGQYVNNTTTFAMGALSFDGTVSGYPVSDFILGDAKHLEVDSPPLEQSGIQNTVSAYLQDNWRIRPRLTLNLGLRYELNFPWVQPHNQWATFHPGQQSVVFPGAPLGEVYFGDPGVPRGMINTQYDDFLPRVGFAWDVTGSGKTVIRGAYGIFDDVLDANFIQNKDQPFNYSFDYPITGSTPDYIVGLTNPLAGQPPIPLSVNLKNPTFTGTASLFYPDPTAVTPYMQDVSFNVQRQLTPNTMIQVGYIGQFGRHLWINVKTNAGTYDSTAGKLVTPYPYAGGITDFATETNSTYNAAQLYVERRMSHGLSITGAYTYGDCIDQNTDYNESGSGSVPNPYDLRAEFGPCQEFSRHLFSASWIWQVPGPGSSRWERIVLQHWVVSGIAQANSGQYWDVTTGKDNYGNGTPDQRPNLVGDPYSGTCPNGDSVGSLGCYFNTSAFDSPAKYTYGNLGRDTQISPGYKNVDFAVLRNFPWGEHRSIQFRAEAYNVFNDVNFEFEKNTVEMSSGTAFGLITNATSARELQFALKLYW